VRPRFNACRPLGGSKPSSACSRQAFSTTSHIGDRTSVTGELWQLRVKHSGTKSPERLVPKSRDQSRVEIIYDFASDEDKVLHTAYINPWGSMRIGKLLEDIDALAGTVANLHTDDDDPDTLPLSMVTASVDDVNFCKKLSLETDIRMTGYVSWVGKSSMEICVNVDQDVSGNKDFSSSVASAKFTFVALDPISGRPCAINPLVPETAEEVQDFERGAARAEEKRQNRIAGRHDDDSEDVHGPETEGALAMLLEKGQTKCELPQSEPR